MTEKLYQDPVLGAVRLQKRPRTRRITLRVHPVKGIVVSMPSFVRYDEGVRFLESRRDWVQEALRRQAGQNADLPEGEDVASLRARAKAEFPPRMQALADCYGFRYNRLTIKHNLSNWGSCSTKGNINLNLNLLRVPAPLQDYVMLHELVHLHHPDHGPAFHAELEGLLADRFAACLPADDYRELLSAASASRARHPLTHTAEKALKAWRLV